MNQIIKFSNYKKDAPASKGKPKEPIPESMPENQKYGNPVIHFCEYYWEMIGKHEYKRDIIKQKLFSEKPTALQVTPTPMVCAGRHRVASAPG